MSHSELVIAFTKAFAESKGLTREQMISIEIGPEFVDYKYIDIENRTINTIEVLR